MPNCIKTIVLLVLVLAVISESGIAQQKSSTPAKRWSEQEREFWNACSGIINTFEFQKISRHQGIYLQLETCRCVNQLGKTELANAIWTRALKFVEEDPKIQYRQQLFEVALEFDDLAAAKRITDLVDEKQQEKYLDKLDLERFRRGEVDALKNYPRQKMDFWKAVDHGNMLVKARRFEAAEKFIETLDIPHEENDPRTVGAFIYEDIADYFHRRGEMDNAKKYVDKAMAIGGGLFYTGFGIQVKKHSIYDELSTEKIKQLGRKAVAHRGHMRRELLQGLIRELVATDRFENAKIAVGFLETQKERDRQFSRIAIRQGVSSSPEETEQVIRQIESSELKTVTQWTLVRELWLEGKKDEANRLFESLIKESEEPQALPKEISRSVAAALGVMAKKEEFVRWFGLQKDSMAKGYFLLEGMKGLAEQINSKK